MSSESSDMAARRLELLRQKTALEAEADEIKGQLSRAKSRAFTTGNYGDSDWFRRAEMALRHKQRQAQDIANQLSALRAERQAAHHKEYHKRFWALANAMRDLADDLALDADERPGDVATGLREASSDIVRLLCEHNAMDDS